MIHTHEAILLGSDIDGTLAAGSTEDASVQAEAKTALTALTMAVAHCRNRRRMPVFFGSVTGRTLKSHETLEQENLALGFASSYMDFVIGSVGAEITARKSKYEPRTLLDNWPDVEDWDPQKIQDILVGAPDLGTLELQPDIAQSSHKLSFYADTSLGHTEYVDLVAQRLAKWSVAAHAIFSGGKYVDLLPKQSDGTPVNKGTALLHCADYLAARDNLSINPRIIFAGDSENDMEAFRSAVETGGYGIVPNNAPTDFKNWAMDEFDDHIYVAGNSFAAGVQEGFEHFTRRR